MGDENLLDINITGLWHKNLYTSLERLQDLERICRDGGVDIVEYLQVDPRRLPEIKFVHLKMMVTEIGILITNARKKIDEKFYTNAKKHLKKIKTIVDLNPTLVFTRVRDEGRHTVIRELSPLYYEILGVLSKIRGKLVTQLSDVLYGKAAR